MTIEEYYAAVVAQLGYIVAQLTTINASLANMATAITGVSDSITAGTGLIFELLLLAGLVALAYWKGHSSLYVVAALSLVLVGWQWDMKIMVPLLLLALYTGYRAARPWLPW